MKHNQIGLKQTQNMECSLIQQTNTNTAIQYKYNYAASHQTFGFDKLPHWV